MTLAEYSLMAFAVLNGARVAAYVPQLRRIYHDPNGASAVSILTWTLFAAANVATVAYSLAVAGDRVVALVFALNTLGCLAIALLTLFKRMNLLPAGRTKSPTSSRKADHSLASMLGLSDAWQRMSAFGPMARGPRMSDNRIRDSWAHWRTVSRRAVDAR